LRLVAGLGRDRGTCAFAVSGDETLVTLDHRHRRHQSEEIRRSILAGLRGVIVACPGIQKGRSGVIFGCLFGLVGVRGRRVGAIRAVIGVGVAGAAPCTGVRSGDVAFLSAFRPCAGV